MAVKIRLSRQGKKNYAFYHIVIADSRAPRDGRLIERIGVYNPNINPAVIELDNDKALDWLYKGAQPTETCRRILSFKGVLLRKHLQEGVKKGAITQEVADQKWNAWVEEKELKLSSKKSELEQSKREAKKSALEEEAKVNQARQEEIAKNKREEEEAIAKAAAAKAAEEEAAAAEIAATKEAILAEKAEGEAPATESAETKDKE
ncbi:MAG: 30S ribosomal protein S16 [Bacteroidales bacterium]|nr:30S ribosomal protein S16 [Bacteroidales bacterium]MDD4655992.1 30S ribosomal protein S16 [Bacteroidales bacterium]